MVSYVLSIVPAHNRYVQLVDPKVTTLSLVGPGRGVLHINSDFQIDTLERQPKGRGKNIWFVLVFDPGY